MTVCKTGWVGLAHSSKFHKLWLMRCPYPKHRQALNYLITGFFISFAIIIPRAMTYPALEGNPEKDVFGQALYDHYQGIFVPPLILYNNYGDPEDVPPEAFLGNEEDFSTTEAYALSLCRGSVLDIGAAGGRHTAWLQKNGLETHGIDISPYCCRLMKEMGLQNIIQQDIMHYTGQKFDTLLMLMNGIGLAGNPEGLVALLRHLKSIIRSGAQVLFDSSDITYLYESLESSLLGRDGVIKYRYAYKSMQSDWFEWLYASESLLKKSCKASGWQMQVICRDDHDQFLVRLFE
jgi:2-polyprenyl-3-methyl-5-hydroxy-6-metoxy-1,4-benzoquinol methylase